MYAVADVKQQFALKRIQANQHVQQLQEQLERERRTKQMAELSITAFNKQIEQEKGEIKKMGEVTEPPSSPESPGLKKGPLAPVPEKPEAATDKSPAKRRAKSAKRP